MVELSKEEFNNTKKMLSQALRHHLKIEQRHLERVSFIGLMYKGHIFEVKNRYLNVPTENYVTVVELGEKYSSQPIVNLMLDSSYLTTETKNVLDDFIDNTVIVEPVY